jgi:VWFA-related protein
VLAGGVVLAARQDRQPFRVATRLVPIDVVVHKDGQPVADLTAADFKIAEDGKDQKIEFFSVIDARSSRSANPASPALPARPAPNVAEVTNRPNGRVPLTATVVLFDRLNTRFEDQVQAREEIIAFLSQVKPDERVALYVLDSNEIRVLHDFTRDAASLVRTLMRYRAATSPELAAADAPAAPLAPIGNGDVDAETAAWLEETRTMVAANANVARAKTTLSGLEEIANHLGGISGRKNLVWVSSSFPLRIDDGREHRTMTAELTRAVRAVSSAGIAIYPVDTRGLIAPFQGVKPTETLSGIGRNAQPLPNPSGIAMTMPAVDAMSELATRTGGRVFYNSNNIGGAIGKAMDDSRVTYVIGYYPTNDRFDGRFRDLKVTVRRPGAEVRHRSGYIATPAGASKSESLVDIAHRALDATGIGVTVNVDGDAVAIRVDPSAITITPSGSTFDVAIDLLVAERLPNGSLVKDLEKTLNLRLTAEQRDQLLKEGFSMTRTVARTPGASLHVVVRDQPSGIAGSVTVRGGA